VVSRYQGIAILLASSMAMAALWPAVQAPSSTIICNYVHPDCLSNHYLLVWVAEVLKSGGSILHNNRYYWPVGDAPWLAGNGSEGIFYLPFHLLFGWPLGSNLYFVLILSLNGLAGYRLSRALGASREASLAAATTGALLLYPIHELGAGRFSQASTCWLGFFLAEWVYFVREPTLRRAITSAVLLAFTSLFYWYHGLFAVLAGGLYLVFFARTSLASPLLLFSTSYLILVGPLLFVFFQYWSSIPGTAEDVFPHPEAIGDSSWPALPFLVAGGRHAGRALPFTTCVFAAIGLLKISTRERIAWLAILLLFLLLMAGPRIPYGPFELIYGTFKPLRRFWWPYRHVVVVNYVLIGLAGVGAAAVLDRLKKGAEVAGFLLALSVPIQLQLQQAPWHAQFSAAKLPHPFYKKLRALPGEVLVEVPLSPQVASAQTLLIYQLDHGKKLLPGHALWVERVRPDSWDEMVAANSFLAALQELERAKLNGKLVFKGEDLLWLRERGVRLISVNEEYFPVALRELVAAYKEVFTGLFGAPVLKGVRVAAWDLESWSGEVEVEFKAWKWPERLMPGGPTLALQAPRPPSPVFSVPGP
jgi:hypothetical protein